MSLNFIVFILIALLCVALAGLGLFMAGVFIFRRLRNNKPVTPPLPQPPLASPLPADATVALPRCPQCHLPLTPNSPEGLCPACLAKVALGSEPSAAAAATVNINPLAEAAPGTRVPPDPSQLAAQFPQLEIIELLGMGGMGMVYKARQTRLDRIVALKILPVDSAPHPSFAERFNREAKALAKLNHPGIVTVYDFGQTSQYYFFVMEFVDGMNLRELLNKEPVTPRQVLELVVQICTALQFAHDEGVVHRDIKPENILLNKKGQVKIADFGLAKLLGAAPDTALTMSQAAMGTMNYMAPEQRQNAQAVDHRADIYSLGVVFYEMLTGEVPMGRFEAPSKRVQVDVRLDEVVLKALEREPARRYQHVSEVKSNVEIITATPPVGPTAAPAAPAPAVLRPTFANSVLKPMIVPFLLWLALSSLAWLFARKLPYLSDLCLFLGVGLLTGGLPIAYFVWRCKLASKGLRWQQLPPAVRRRAGRRIIPIAMACVAVCLLGMACFPSRTTEWREEWFYPKSHSYEKLVLSGNIQGYQIPAWSKHSVGGSGTMALKIYRQDSTPAALVFSLPGLRIENDSHDPGQPPDALTFEVLTNWMHDSARLDVAQPQAQTEARQLMKLFEPYYDTSPPSWQELTTKAVTDLDSFNLGGFSSPLAQYGAFGSLFFALLAFPGICACLGYFIAFPFIKRAFAEGRTEIEASGWTPPTVVAVRFPTAFWVLFVFGVLALSFTVGDALRGKTGPMLLILLSMGILMIAVLQLHSRRLIQQARENGLWPQLGELPSLEQVKRLAQSGEKILAIKLYRQMHGASLADAKAAVEKLMAQPATPQNAKAAPASDPAVTPVSSQPRLSRMALVGAAWVFGFLMFALGSLIIAAYSQFPNGKRPETASQVVMLLVVRWGTATSPSTPWLDKLLEFTIMSIGLTAPFGATILGYQALSQIRYSAGRLYGLGLALFDALIFPLLVVDVLVFVLVGLIMLALASWLGGPLPPGSARAVGPVALAGVLISAALDFFIVRKVWRLYRR